MSWRALTEADMLTGISGKEMTAYRAAALNAGQTDPVTSTIAEVMDLVRGYIPTRLGLAGTIPQRLVPAAVDIAVVRFLARVNVDPGEGRRYQRDQAVKLLESVQKQQFRVEEPLTPDTTDTPATLTPQIDCRFNPFSIHRQDGL